MMKMANKEIIKAPVFFKDALVTSERFKHDRDLLNAVLKDNVTYSIEDVETIINSFKKGKVK